VGCRVEHTRDGTIVRPDTSTIGNPEPATVHVLVPVPLSYDREALVDEGRHARAAQAFKADQPTFAARVASPGT